MHLAIYGFFRKIWQNIGYFLLFKIPDKLCNRKIKSKDNNCINSYHGSLFKGKSYMQRTNMETELIVGDSQDKQNPVYMYILWWLIESPKRLIWSHASDFYKKVDILAIFGWWWGSTKRSPFIRYWHVPHYPHITVLCVVGEYKKVTM